MPAGGLEETSDLPFFTVYSADSNDVGQSDSCRARLGRISVKGRKALETPDFFALTSRGVVPHISPDVVGDQTEFAGVYTATEDCK